ncbi:hypothetical protein YC2023_035656 [Brassica napus]
MARSKCHRSQSQSQTKGRLRNAGGGKFEKSQNPSLRATDRGKKKKKVNWRLKKMTDPKNRFCAQLGGNRIQAAEHEVYFYTWTVASDRYLA